MKKVLCYAIVGIFAGVILYGSGSVDAVKIDDLSHGKIFVMGYMNNNASFLAPMPLNYVAQPSSGYNLFTFGQMRQHDFFVHHVMDIEYITQ